MRRSPKPNVSSGSAAVIGNWVNDPVTCALYASVAIEQRQEPERERHRGPQRAASARAGASTRARRTTPSAPQHRVERAGHEDPADEQPGDHEPAAPAGPDARAHRGHEQQAESEREEVAEVRAALDHHDRRDEHHRAPRAAGHGGRRRARVRAGRCRPRSSAAPSASAPAGVPTTTSADEQDQRPARACTARRTSGRARRRSHGWKNVGKPPVGVVKKPSRSAAVCQR